jgi:hypothetical protein
VALGITDDAYTALLEAQGGHCALCPATPKTRRLSVDHDHKTGAVRGLLCHRCNRALPTWVSVRWLLGAARYLGGSWEDFRREAPFPTEHTSDDHARSVREYEEWLASVSAGSAASAAQ